MPWGNIFQFLEVSLNEFLKTNHYLDSLRFQMPAEQEKKRQQALKKHAAEIFQNILSRYNRSQIKTYQVMSSVILTCLRIVNGRKKLPGLAATLSKWCTPLLWHRQRQAPLMPFARSIQTRWKTPARREGKLRLHMDAYPESR